MAALCPSVVRRLALPLGLALLLHALPVAVVYLLPTAVPPRQSAAGTPPGRFSVFVTPDRPRPPITEWPDPLSEIAPNIEEDTKPIEVPISATPPSPGSKTSPESEPRGPGGSDGGPPARPAAQGLLKVHGAAQRIVYVVDRSMSMGLLGKLEMARREVLASLRELPPDVHFQIVAYNGSAELLLPGDLVPATSAVLADAACRLGAVDASGQTSHVRALERALCLSPAPDLVFLITDADELTDRDVQRITNLNRGRAVIHVVELAAAPTDGSESLLARLAGANGGSHRWVRPVP